MLCSKGWVAGSHSLASDYVDYVLLGSDKFELSRCAITNRVVFMSTGQVSERWQYAVSAGSRAETTKL
jgi:hypothetical protein